MPVAYSWHDPDKRVLLYSFSGKWAWDEVHQTFRASWEEVRQQDHMVDSISDLGDARNIPPSALTHVRSLSQNRPKNTGVMVLVGASTFVTVSMQTFSQIFQTTLKRDVQVVFAKSMDEALAFIADKQAERSIS